MKYPMTCGYTLKAGSYSGGPGIPCLYRIQTFTTMLIRKPPIKSILSQFSYTLKLHFCNVSAVLFVPRYVRHFEVNFLKVICHNVCESD
jgi:hypothetical protein